MSEANFGNINNLVRNTIHIEREFRRNELEI